MSNETSGEVESQVLVEMTADIAAAYLAHNSLPHSEIGNVISSIFSALGTVSNAEFAQEKKQPAVPIKRSVHQDYVVCLEDGRKLKMLKRHLRTRYNLSPDEYRAKWGLPSDYPMVAPSYAAERSMLAKRIGLGRKPRASGRVGGRRASA